MPLTEIACRNAKCPQDKPRARFSDSLGLYLEVLPAGGKYWRLKYRFAGKEKRLGLGVYPAVALKDARIGRDEARRLLAAGQDPSAARQEAKLAQQVALDNSFEAIARAWHEHWKGPRSPRHADYVIRRLEADVFPVLGNRAISEITAPQLLAMAKKIEARGALDIARRSWQTCGQIFEYGIAHGACERNPTKDVKPSVALKPRTREHFARVSEKELPDLLRKMAVYDGSPYTRCALQLVALTFVRTSELIESTWDEFDLEAGEWRIPAERMKMRTPHIVPLSTQAIDQLRCLHQLRNLSPFVFPGERDHEKPMSNGAILMALRRMGYANKMTGHGVEFHAILTRHFHPIVTHPSSSPAGSRCG